jgi:hypothetical protein
MEWGPLHQHLWVEELFPFFRILWFLWMDIFGSVGDTGFCVNDMFSLSQILIRLWFNILPWGFHLNQQWLFGMTVISIVPRYFLELAPLSSVLLRLPITLLCWCLGMDVLGLSILSFSFSLVFKDTLTILQLFHIWRIKLSLVLLLKFFHDFDGISISNSQWRDVQQLHFGLDEPM